MGSVMSFCRSRRVPATVLSLLILALRLPGTCWSGRAVHVSPNLFIYTRAHFGGDWTRKAMRQALHEDSISW